MRRPTNSAELIAARAMAFALYQELSGYVLSKNTMLRSRLAEIVETLAPIVFDAQPAWDELPPQARDAIRKARASMIVARRDVEAKNARSTLAPRGPRPLRSRA